MKKRASDPASEEPVPMRSSRFEQFLQAIPVGVTIFSPGVSSDDTPSATGTADRLKGTQQFDFSQEIFTAMRQQKTGYFLFGLTLFVLMTATVRAQLPEVKINFFTGTKTGTTEVFEVGDKMRCDVEFHHPGRATPNPGDVIFTDGAGNPLPLADEGRIFINSPYHNAWLGTLTYWVTFPEDLTSSSTQVHMKIPCEYGGDSVFALKTVTVVKGIDRRPALLSPEDGATEIQLRNYGQVLVKWQPVQNVTRYHVQVATSPTFEPASIAIETDQLTSGPAPQWYPTLASTTTYYWRVRSLTTGTNWSAWSEVWEFTTQSGGAPSFPEEGTAEVALPVTLGWTSFPGSTSYHLQIATTPDFGTAQEKGEATAGSVIIEEDIEDTTYTPASLEPNTTYYWRVAPTINGTFAKPSAPRSFTTAGISGVAATGNRATHLTVRDNLLSITGNIDRGTELHLYDLLGRRILSASLPETTGGTQSSQLEPELSTSPLFYELRSGEEVRRGRIR